MSQKIENKIPQYFTKDFFKAALEHGLRKQLLNIKTIEIEKLNLGGENYCSNIYRAAVSYFFENGAENFQNSLIIKSMPKDKQAALSALRIYLKEIIFYLDIKPKLEALMWNAVERPWTIGARYIYSTASPEETIIFEDLCKQEFQMQSRQNGLDLLHSKLVMKKLAEYHAATMLMAEKEPKTIREAYPFGLLNEHTIKSQAFRELTAAQLLKLAELVEQPGKGLQRIAEKLRFYNVNFERNLMKAIYPIEGAFNVLNHGDVWINNLFFKYNHSNEPLDVQFIDFQLCYYGSPGFDINYFLTTSVQLDILRSKREFLIEFYYQSLIGTLKNLRHEPILPKYETLINEIHEREAYALFVAIAFFPLMSMADSDSQDVSLETLQNSDFINRKIERMFMSNTRTMNTLMYLLQRADQMGIFD